MSGEVELVLGALGLIAVIAIWVASWWLVAWWLARRLDGVRWPAPIVTVQAPSPVVVPAPAVTVVPEKRRPIPSVTVRLVSGSGRDLGTHTMIGRAPTVTLPAGCFVADRQDPDGTWVYRRVGRERP